MTAMHTMWQDGWPPEFAIILLCLWVVVFCATYVGLRLWLR